MLLPLIILIRHLLDDLLVIKREKALFSTLILGLVHALWDRCHLDLTGRGINVLQVSHRLV